MNVTVEIPDDVFDLLLKTALAEKVTVPQLVLVFISRGFRRPTKTATAFFTPKQEKQFRELYKLGYSDSEIGSRMNMSANQIVARRERLGVMSSSVRDRRRKKD